ncbi:MAG: class I SAM-dependent methyltransferase [Methylococcales bacterium]|nr:class I SAM-dependent methyltransferase [Methylococcales bacterium]
MRYVNVFSAYFFARGLNGCIVIYAGLKDGMKLVDYGCGSGRLSTALAKELQINYLGIDIIDALLEYARLKSPAEYTFLNHQDLNVPIDDASVDMICAFSLFTHLLQAESYLYMEDMYRALKPGGRLVFSFLEFALPSHWFYFEATVTQHKTNTTPHLNMFMEKTAIQQWANHIGFKVVEFINGDINHFNGNALGQSVAILEK